jgi:predicted permease
MPELFRRLQYLLHRRRLERELANDMEAHREMAARAGHANFGNDLHLREQSRDAWGWTWIDHLLQDLRYAARSLRKSPGFTLAAILMLALGIGVNVAVFGFFNLFVLRPIQVRDAQSLLRFHRRGTNQYAFAVPYPEAAFFRQNSRTLASVIGVNSTSVSIEGEEKPEEARFVTGNFFRDLGGSSAVGRTLDPSIDEAPAADPVLVLSNGYWRRRFAADPSVVGRTLRVNNRQAVIVGVAAADFSGVGGALHDPAFFAPIVQQPYFVEGSRLLTDFSIESPGVSLWGRPGPGVTPSAAEEELRSLAVELRRQYPDSIWENERLPSEPGGYLSAMVTGNRRGTGTEQRDPIVPVLALAGSLTLMIFAVACGNLGGLLLARSVARQREISIRIAIGAGRGRLIRQLFTESLLLAGLGAAAGVALGSTVLHALLAYAGAPAWADGSPDWRIAAFALTAAFGSAILFGLTPALQIGRQRHRANITRHVLIAAQVAASCVLLIVTGLLGRALTRVAFSSPGFEYKQTIAVSSDLARNGYSPARSRAYLNALEDQVRALPGVQSVSLALSPPLGHVTITTGTDVEGHHVEFNRNHVSPEYFQTMAIPILRGRALRPNDRHVMVVSDSVARSAWPGKEPLGQTMDFGERFTVVGIAADVRNLKFGATETGAHAYFPIEEDQWPNLTVVARTAGVPQELAKAVAPAAGRLNPAIRPTIELLSSAFRERMGDVELVALAVSILGSLAQLLACFGIIGLVSYAVSQRTREIGIRMALGAKPGQVLAVVLRRLVLPVTIGLILGVAGAAGLAQFVRGRLYGISHLDPAAYAAAIGFFALTAGIAAVLPARKALRIDPLRALRHD